MKPAWSPPTPAQVREAILSVLAAPSDAEEGPRMTFHELCQAVCARLRPPSYRIVGLLGIIPAVEALLACDPPQIATDGDWYWRTIPRDAIDGPDADEPAPWPVEEARAGWPTEAAEEVERLEAQLAQARAVADRERETAASYGALVEETRQELRLTYEVIDAARVLARQVWKGSASPASAGLVRGRIDRLDAFVRARLEQEQATRDPDAMGKALVESEEQRIRQVAERGPFA